MINNKHYSIKVDIQKDEQGLNILTDKFQTMLFLPENKYRIDAGGLRTKSYFKESCHDKPLISIITVVFNGEKHLRETIESVIYQNYDNVEYIIIDGGSTDRTIEIIKEFEDKIDYWVSEKDDGLYDAINKGIKLSNGDIIGIINSDDWYHENVFQKIIENYNESVNIYYGNLNFFRNNILDLVAIAPDSLEKMNERMIIFHPSTFITSKTYKKYGLYDKTFKITADYELLLRYYVNNLAFKKIDMIISNFRDGGISSNFSFINLKENIRSRKNNNCRGIIFKELLIFIYVKIKWLFSK